MDRMFLIDMEAMGWPRKILWDDMIPGQYSFLFLELCHET